MGKSLVYTDLGPKGREAMVSRREALQEALRVWRAAERDLVENGDGAEREANVVHLRNEYNRIYTDNMMDNIARLHEAEGRRALSIPSTPDFHNATHDTETVAADIWEQARRGDRDSPNGGGDKR